MGIFDKLEQAQAQAADFEVRREQLGPLQLWLEVRRRSARIVALNAALFAPPLVLGVNNAYALLFALSTLIMLSALQPNTDSVADSVTVGWQRNIIVWSQKWWIGALVALFFASGAWIELFQSHSYHGWTTGQGMIVLGLSALAWHRLKFGEKTKAMIEAHNSLGVPYVWSWW